jgi:hypothetical protein
MNLGNTTPLLSVSDLCEQEAVLRPPARSITSGHRGGPGQHLHVSEAIGLDRVEKAAAEAVLYGKVGPHQSAWPGTTAARWPTGGVDTSRGLRSSART